VTKHAVCLTGCTLLTHMHCLGLHWPGCADARMSHYITGGFVRVEATMRLAVSLLYSARSWQLLTKCFLEWEELEIVLHACWFLCVFCA
jgi:hypothetical protein